MHTDKVWTKNHLPSPNKDVACQTSRRLAAKVVLMPEGPDSRRKTSRLPPVVQLSVAKKGNCFVIFKKLY
jgi:hypothetical protein